MRGLWALCGAQRNKKSGGDDCGGGGGCGGVKQQHSTCIHTWVSAQRAATWKQASVQSQAELSSCACVCVVCVQRDGLHHQYVVHVDPAARHCHLQLPSSLRQRQVISSLYFTFQPLNKKINKNFLCLQSIKIIF